MDVCFSLFCIVEPVVERTALALPLVDCDDISHTKNTSYIVVGEEPGSKLKNAEKLGVKILNEKEFLEMIK